MVFFKLKNRQVINKISNKTQLDDTFHHFLLKRIVRDVSIETVASNQTGVVFHNLFWNTVLLLWPTIGDNLLEKKSTLKIER